MVCALLDNAPQQHENDLVQRVMGLTSMRDPAARLCRGLFVSQREHGIDAHSAARGNVTRSECDGDEYGDGERKR